jgi:hypothetical protein
VAGRVAAHHHRQDVEHGAKEPEMQSLMTRELTSAFAADAERRWLFGHPYRVERPARAGRTVRGARAAAPAGRTARARRLRAA